MNLLHCSEGTPKWTSSRKVQLSEESSCRRLAAFCFRNLFSFCITSSPTSSISSRSAFGDDNCLPFLVFPLVYFLVSVSLDLLLFGVLSLLWYGPRSFPHSFYSTLPTSSRSPLQLASIRIFASFKHCSSCWSSELFLPSNTAPQHISSDSLNPTLSHLFDCNPIATEQRVCFSCYSLLHHSRALSGSFKNS